MVKDVRKECPVSCEGWGVESTVGTVAYSSYRGSLVSSSRLTTFTIVIAAPNLCHPIQYKVKDLHLFSAAKKRFHYITSNFQEKFKLKGI